MYVYTHKHIYLQCIHNSLQEPGLCRARSRWVLNQSTRHRQPPGRKTGTELQVWSRVRQNNCRHDHKTSINDIHCRLLPLETPGCKREGTTRQLSRCYTYVSFHFNLYIRTCTNTGMDDLQSDSHLKLRFNGEPHRYHFQHLRGPQHAPPPPQKKKKKEHKARWLGKLLPCSPVRVKATPFPTKKPSICSTPLGQH